MSIASSAHKRTGTSDNNADYRQGFVRDSLRLIARAYALIDPHEQGEADEEVITERMAAAINTLVEAAEAEPWMHRFHVTDNLPVRHPGREGKKRPRVDIEIISVGPGPRPRFHMEAKRLGRGSSAGDYVGPEGFGCILRAEYARESDIAGMLGYVQSGTCEGWAGKIREKLWSNKVEYKLVASSRWRVVAIAGELEHVYLTEHDRPTIGRQVEVYHTLLLFCKAASP